MPVREYAESLGLAGVPKIKFLSRERAKARDGARIAEEESDAEEVSEGEDEDDVVGSDEVASEEDEKAPSSSKQVKSFTCQFVYRGLRHPQTNVVRTKYDRMFERKNQDVLSEHYNKLIVHDEDLVGRDDDGSDDDFIKLSRANHALSDDDDDAGDDDESKGPRASGSGLAKADAENISKRKLKLGQSKKAMIKYRDAPQHLKFDDDGVARDAYKIGTAEDFFKAGESGVREAERSHAEAERGKLKEADVQDREQARERRREKKRKRKDREREVSVFSVSLTFKLSYHDFITDAGRFRRT
jgi:ATP-dependent RNA helicase DDX10/DBP4